MVASAVVVGAGSGTRLGGAERKAWVELAGRPLWWHACRALRSVRGIAECVLVVHRDDLPRVQGAEAAALLGSAGVRAVVPGGARRQDSVLAGVRATDAASRHVLVHDAARPFVSGARVAALLDALDSHPAALLATPVAATVKSVDDAGSVTSTIDRRRLRLASTPQGGERATLIRLLEEACAADAEVTDESSLFERAGLFPAVVEDSSLNFKVTMPDDLALARALAATDPPRVGHGYDIHRLVTGRPLVLGGVTIPSEVGLLGHSDGDCVLHAVIEALLGAAGLPDIGEHFPDTDPAWRGADSGALLARVVAELRGLGLRPAQVDCSILAERPRLGPWKAAIKERLRAALDLPADRVAVKARSGEGLDAIGRGEAIAVHCTAVIAPSGPGFWPVFHPAP